MNVERKAGEAQVKEKDWGGMWGDFSFLAGSHDMRVMSRPIPMVVSPAGGGSCF